MPFRRAAGGRNWHEVYLLAMAVLVGVTGLVAPEGRSQAVETSFPAWGQIAWYAGLLAGAGLGILGILRSPAVSPAQLSDMEAGALHRLVNRQITGLTIERFALLLLTGLCVAYVLGAVAVVGLTRASGTLGAAFVAAFALANAARARQIRITLARVRDDSRPGEPR